MGRTNKSTDNSPSKEKHKEMFRKYRLVHKALFVCQTGVLRDYRQGKAYIYYEYQHGNSIHSQQRCLEMNHEKVYQESKQNVDKRKPKDANLLTYPSLIRRRSVEKQRMKQQNHTPNKWHLLMRSVIDMTV